MEPLPVACTLTAADLARRRELLRRQVVRHARDVRPLDDGWALRFDAADGLVPALAGLIELERRCCRFLAFTLRLEPAEGPVWLELRGPDGAKSFIREMLLKD